MRLKAAGIWTTLMAVTMLVCASVGCGTNAAVVPPANQCVGAQFTGTVKDSLTNTAIAGAKVVFETGTELSITPVYDFSPAVTGTTDAQGAFNLCASAVVATPAVLVFEALDASGNAYPATITPVSQGGSLGTILLGACRLNCAFPGQTQSSAPTTISGVITTSPVAESGTVTAQASISALDGTKNVWSVTIEGLAAEQPDTFQTAAGSCPAMGELCQSYTYTLPSQAPVSRVGSNYAQMVVAPTYLITATTAATSSCTQPFLATSLQANGSPLTGAPGSQITAATLSFTGCH